MGCKGSHARVMFFLVLPDLWPNHQTLSRLWSHPKKNPQCFGHAKNTKNVHCWHNTPNEVQPNGLWAGLGSWPHCAILWQCFACCMTCGMPMGACCGSHFGPNGGGANLKISTVTLPHKSFWQQTLVPHEGTKYFLWETYCWFLHNGPPNMGHNGCHSTHPWAPQVMQYAKHCHCPVHTMWP